MRKHMLGIVAAAIALALMAGSAYAASNPMNEYAMTSGGSLSQTGSKVTVRFKSVVTRGRGHLRCNLTLNVGEGQPAQEGFAEKIVPLRHVSPSHPAVCRVHLTVPRSQLNGYLASGKPFTFWGSASAYGPRTGTAEQDSLIGYTP